MDKPFEELATLIGKLLAKRWLDRNATLTQRPVGALQKHAAGCPNTEPPNKARSRTTRS